MENIFKENKIGVVNNGFTERIMERVATIHPPERSTYRTPTLLAGIVTVLAITLISVTVGVNTMNEKYEKLCISITLRTNTSDHLEK